MLSTSTLIKEDHHTGGVSYLCRLFPPHHTSIKDLETSIPSPPPPPVIASEMSLMKPYLVVSRY